MGEVILNKKSAIEEAKKLYLQTIGNYPTDFEAEYYTDLDKLTKKLDIVVSSRDFNKLFAGLDIDAEYRKTSGLLIKKNGKFYIYSNCEESASRQRFTIAHELGHYHLNHIENSKDDNFIMRDEVSSGGTNRKEICANAFAAELLMPEYIMRELVKRNYSERQMALGLKVSIQAIQTRLEALKL